MPMAEAWEEVVYGKQQPQQAWRSEVRASRGPGSERRTQDPPLLHCPLSSVHACAGWAMVGVGMGPGWLCGGLGPG